MSGNQEIASTEPGKDQGNDALGNKKERSRS